MEANLPVKRLNRLSWMFGTILAIIVYIIVSQYQTKIYRFAFSGFTLICIALIGYVDVMVLSWLSKRTTFKSRKSIQFRFLTTYPASILIYLLLWPVLAHITRHPWSVLDWRMFFVFVGSGIVMNTMVMVLHDSVLLYENKLRTDLELSRLKAANAEAANLLLKQQIQPHFLFNALNTVKALYHKDPRIADTYIVHMANFLRASIYHHTANVSSLEDEVQLLYDYLEMQRIRFGAALDCTVMLSEASLKSFWLPSFSLQPLLENAIKHNDFTRQDPLRVTLSEENGWLTISNNLQKKRMKVASVNYGLANLAERYQLWSGDEIIIREEQHTFSVSIKLLKNEHSHH